MTTSLELSLTGPKDVSLSVSDAQRRKSIKREHLIGTINTLIKDGYKYIVIDGSEGIGKTTLLIQFLDVHQERTISYFANPASKLSSSAEYFIEDLGRQMLYFIHKKELDESLALNEASFDRILIDFNKSVKKANKTVFIILDGLDSIEKADYEGIKAIIHSLPWGVNNVQFLLGGSESKLKSLIPKEPAKNIKSFHVPMLSLGEAEVLFNDTATLSYTEDQFKELYHTWQGNPRRIEQIQRILKQGISLEDFLNKDISAKSELLEIEWAQANVDGKDEETKKLIALVALDEQVRDIYFISNVTGVQIDLVESTLRDISLIKIENKQVYFISKEIKRFASIKLKPYEDYVFPLIISYYQDKNDVETFRNLPSYFEKKNDWNGIVNLLDLNNLSTLLSKSNSVYDIKNKINSGYKASTKLTNAFDRTLRFALHKSTISQLQYSEIRESYIEACISLNKLEDALLAVSDASLKEDKFKLLTIFAKGCKDRNIKIDQAIIDQIQNLYSTIDLEYIKDNITELSLNIAVFLPELAVKIVEKASGIKDTNTSLEWLLSYLTIMTNKDSLKITGGEDTKALTNIRKKLGDQFIENFVESIGLGVDKLKSQEIIANVSLIENTSDRLLVLRSWIKQNSKSDNIAEVVIFAINILAQESSNVKPTTTMLLDIIQPIVNIESHQQISNIIEIIEDLLIVITNPTADKVRLQLILAECELKCNIKAANIRLVKLYGSLITAIEDYPTRLAALADCWAFLRKALASGLDPLKCVYREDEVQDDLLAMTTKLLESTSEHFIDLENCLDIIAKFDINTCTNIISHFNTQSRRDSAYKSIIESYTALKFQQWSVIDIKRIYNLITSRHTKDKTLLKIFDSINRQKQSGPIDLKKVVELLPLVNDTSSCSLKSYLLVKSILILNGSYTGPDGIAVKFPIVQNKLVGFLKENWEKIDSQIEKLEVGFSIASLLVDFDRHLSQEYFEAAQSISNDSLINNFSHSSALAETVSMTIRAYIGLLSIDGNASSTDLEELIELVEEDYIKLRLWNELAVRTWLCGCKTKAIDLVVDKVIPLIEIYKKPNKGQFYYDRALVACAVSIYLTKPHTLDLYLNDATQEFIELIVTDICSVILTRTYQFDPNEETTPSADFEFEDASQYINLLSRVKSDETLYFRIQELCKAGIAKRNKFPLEQRLIIKDKLNKLILDKLPRSVSGVSHEGYKIVAEMHISHFDINSFKEADYSKFIDGLVTRTEKIPNSADRSYIFSVIAAECSSKYRRRNDILEKAFAEADLSLSHQGKFQRYELALETAKKISPEKFVSKLQKLNQDIYSLDDSEYFPTHRRLIDMAYQHNKDFAERLVSSLDKDPGRSKNSTSVIQHLNKLEIEQEVMDDFNNYEKVKSRNDISQLAWKMLGQLNSGKRGVKDLDKTSSLLKAASQLPFQFASPIFQYYLQNASKKLSFSKQISAMNALYRATLDNAKLAHAYILNISNVKSFSTSKTISITKGTDLVFTPGSRTEAIDFINDYIVQNSTKEVYIIDPYFGIQDILFLKTLSEITSEAQITVITSVDSDKKVTIPFDEAYANAWSEISCEPAPQVTVYRMGAIGGGSPFHDRWILLNDIDKGLMLGSSINSIGEIRTSAISVMSSFEVSSVFHSVVEPFVINRAKTYGKLRITRQSFDMY